MILRQPQSPAIRVARLLRSLYRWQQVCATKPYRTIYDVWCSDPMLLHFWLVLATLLSDYVSPAKSFRQVHWSALGCLQLDNRVVIADHARQFPVAAFERPDHDKLCLSNALILIAGMLKAVHSFSVATVAVNCSGFGGNRNDGWTPCRWPTIHLFGL